MSETRRNIAIKVIRSAGNYLKEQVLNEKIKGWIKPDSTWKSELDDIAESLIVRSIQDSFPEDGILSEESQEQKTDNQYRWVIDPLDGSHNLLCGFHDFSCGLALEKAGELIMGVIYLPMYDQLFRAEKGQGAFCNDVTIKVSQAKELKGGVFFLDTNDFRYDRRRALDSINKFVEAGCSIRAIACSHRTMTYLASGASGKSMVSISWTANPWDFAPGTLILREAGGKVTNELVLDSSKGIIATNGFVHQEVLDLIRRQ